MIDYKNVYDHALILSAIHVIGDKSSQGDTQMLSKIKLVLRTRFDTNHQNPSEFIESSHIFGPNVYANALLRIRSYAPAVCLCPIKGR